MCVQDLLAFDVWLNLDQPFCDNPKLNLVIISMSIKEKFSTISSYIIVILRLAYIILKKSNNKVHKYNLAFSRWGRQRYLALDVCFIYFHEHSRHGKVRELDLRQQCLSISFITIRLNVKKYLM